MKHNKKKKFSRNAEQILSSHDISLTISLYFHLIFMNLEEFLISKKNNRQTDKKEKKT